MKFYPCECSKNTIIKFPHFFSVHEFNISGRRAKKFRSQCFKDHPNTYFIFDEKVIEHSCKNNL